MPFKDSDRHLRDILECIDFIHQFLRGMDLNAYRQDEKTRAAVERKLQILTEAVIRLETDAPEAYPGIDWKGYRGMGNFLRHSYRKISDEIVWNTIQDDLPVLKSIADDALRRFSQLPPDAGADPV